MSKDEIITELTAMVLMQDKKIKKLKNKIRAIKQHIEVYEEYLEEYKRGDDR